MANALYLNQLVQKLPSLFHGTILWSLLIDFIPMPYLYDELLIMKSFRPIQSNSSSYSKSENESYSSIAASYPISSQTVVYNFIPMDSTQQGLNCSFAQQELQSPIHSFVLSSFSLLLFFPRRLDGWTQRLIHTQQTGFPRLGIHYVYFLCLVLYNKVMIFLNVYWKSLRMIHAQRTNDSFESWEYILYAIERMDSLDPFIR